MEIRGRIETIQTTCLLWSARILRRVLEAYCHSNSSERPSAKTDMENSQGVIMITIKETGSIAQELPEYG